MFQLLIEGYIYTHTARKNVLKIRNGKNKKRALLFLSFAVKSIYTKKRGLRGKAFKKWKKKRSTWQRSLFRPWGDFHEIKIYTKGLGTHTQKSIHTQQRKSEKKSVISSLSHHQYDSEGLSRRLGQPMKKRRSWPNTTRRSWGGRLKERKWERQREKDSSS